jgi:hypothetical protein
MSIFDKPSPSDNDDDTKKVDMAASAAGPPAEHPEDAGDGTDTIEAWAERKKLLPDFLPGAAAERRMNPDYWKFAAAKALRRWGDGQRVTESEFDAAVAEAAGHIHR